MKKLNNATLSAPRSKRPIRILQFGEGNFLRAFVDWMIQITNEQGLTDMSVAAVSPRFRRSEMLTALHEQDGLYHLVLEGIDNGQPVRSIKLIESIAEAFTPLDNAARYNEIIESPELRFIVSNTTEAGIRYDDDDILTPFPTTFPGKIASLLWRRFNKFGADPDKGIIFLCCELIENNGSRLKEYVLRHVANAHLPAEFTTWINESCIFCNTLVDRIVPGFPKDNIGEIREETGYDDKAVVTGEFFHLWAIGGEGYEKVQRLLPLNRAGLNVMFMPSITDFRDKKVRILNGSHTALVPVALQLGCTTVLEAFSNPLVNRFVKEMVNREVLPMIAGNPDELQQFAEAILERFYNPYIKHMLTSIALNSLSKWEARNWPTVRDCWTKRQLPARHEIFSFAALLSLYGPESSHKADDNPAHLETIHRNWNPTDWETTVARIVESGIFIENFNEIVPQFSKFVAKYLRDIEENGMEAALTRFLSE